MQQSNNDKKTDTKPSLSWSTGPTTGSTPAKNPSLSSTPLSLPKMTPNNGNMTARYMGIFVGGLIFGVVVAWGWSAMTIKSGTTNTIVTTGDAAATIAGTGMSSNTNIPTTGEPNSSAAAAVTLSASDITVETPQKAGQSVVIGKMGVSKPTWVVVYDNIGGKQGNVLGAQLFFTTSGGTVTLLRPTMAGKMYFVGRATDNGDRKFQKANDQPIVDENGNQILVMFTAK